MSALLWPQRKRCRTCRRGFDFVVLRQLYCSYACAGLPEPDPDARPRTCYFRHARTWQSKKVFFSMEEAQAAAIATRDQLLQAYLCSHCHMYHLGHDRPYLDDEEFAEKLNRRRELRELRDLKVDSPDEFWALRLMDPDFLSRCTLNAQHQEITIEQLVEIQRYGRLLDPDAEARRQERYEHRRKAKKKRYKKNKKERDLMPPEKPQELWQLKLQQFRDQMESSE